ncbi:MAG: hypothetical protein ACFCGT_08375 [Sandaracinaceae bacterium]
MASLRALTHAVVLGGLCLAVTSCAQSIERADVGGEPDVERRRSPDAGRDADRDRGVDQGPDSGRVGQCCPLDDPASAAFECTSLRPGGWARDEETCPPIAYDVCRSDFRIEEDERGCPELRHTNRWENSCDCPPTGGGGEP